MSGSNRTFAILVSMKFSVERIVGGSSEQRNSELEKLRQIFKSQDIEGLAEIEVEKTSEFLECIDVANKVTTEILEKYGIQKDPVDEKNIHMVKHEIWPEHLAGTAAFFRFVHQFIIIPDDVPKLKLVVLLIHEIFHFKSYLAGQMLSDNRLEDYRVGLTVTTRDGEETQLTAVNEAVTESLTYQAMQTDTFKTFLATELAEVKKNMEHHADAEDEDGQPLYDEDTYYVSIGDERPDGSSAVFTSKLSYPKERVGLRLLTEKLYLHNTEKFKNPDEIYQLFVKSAYDGDLLRIGKLIDTTYGKGTLRQLANPSSPDHFEEIINQL